MGRIQANYFKLYCIDKYMAEEYAQQDAYGGVFSDLNTRIRDLEEKHRLIKDKMILIGETFIKERNKNFSEIQDMKKTVEELKGENQRLKELLSRIGDMLDKSARKEELMILQRQFDLFRK